MSENIIYDSLQMVERFQDEILGFPIPNNSTQLDRDEVRAAYDHLNEELIELLFADSIADQADALIDLIYVALGRLVRMGIAPRMIFEVVHDANMQKHRGKLAKRPNEGYDAVKPADWEPPDFTALLTLTLEDARAVLATNKVRQAMSFAESWDSDNFFSPESPTKLTIPSTPARMIPRELPKILILGYAKHGKDTVCEYFRDKWGFSFVSSSRFIGEEIMFPLFNKEVQIYGTSEDCFQDRANHRQAWYEAILTYNTPDKTKLAQGILERGDMYCGMRASAEFHACKAAGLFDHVFWVDRLDYVQKENRDSCTVEPWMADHVIDNNGTLEELQTNIDNLVMKVVMK